MARRSKEGWKVSRIGKRGEGESGKSRKETRQWMMARVCSCRCCEQQRLTFHTTGMVNSAH